jgi:hypothetical protein
VFTLGLVLASILRASSAGYTIHQPAFAAIEDIAKV